jgi:molybdopterin/thiamine biosynthesis adenylyltransferase
MYIIESPSSQNFVDNIKEGDLLSRILDLAGIPNKLFTVIDQESFGKVIDLIISDYKQKREQRIGNLPWIHISCHGNEQSIILSNDDRIDYKDLLELLRPIGEEFRDIDTVTPLHITMSSCYGIFASNGDDTETSPFSFMIGPIKEIRWTDSLLAYAVFYNAFITKNLGIVESVKAMNESIVEIELFKIKIGKNLEEEIRKSKR